MIVSLFARISHGTKRSSDVSLCQAPIVVTYAAETKIWFTSICIALFSLGRNHGWLKYNFRHNYMNSLNCNRTRGTFSETIPANVFLFKFVKNSQRNRAIPQIENSSLGIRTERSCLRQGHVVDGSTNKERKQIAKSVSLPFFEEKTNMP